MRTTLPAWHRGGRDAQARRGGSPRGLGWLGQEILGELVGEALVELVKAPFRRRKRRPPLTGLERGAVAGRSRFWAEVMAEARWRAGDRVDPTLTS